MRTTLAPTHLPCRTSVRMPPVLGNNAVNSDQQGRFRLQDLVPRSYRLRASERQSLAFAVTEPVAAGGAEITITLDRCGHRIALSGRVIDPRGKPIARAKVFACRSMPEPGYDLGNTVVLASTETDDAGEFRLEDVCSQVDSISVQVEAAGPGRICHIDAASNSDSITLTVGRMSRLQIELVTAGLTADSVSILDAQGIQLQIGARRGGGSSVAGESMPIVAGKTEPLIVPEDAATAVLYQGHKEVNRVPIRAAPGELTTLRL